MIELQISQQNPSEIFFSGTSLTHFRNNAIEKDKQVIYDKRRSNHVFPNILIYRDFVRALANAALNAHDTDDFVPIIMEGLPNFNPNQGLVLPLNAVFIPSKLWIPEEKLDVWESMPELLQGIGRERFVDVQPLEYLQKIAASRKPQDVILQTPQL